jgi:hypothetical protein
VSDDIDAELVRQLDITHRVCYHAEGEGDYRSFCGVELHVTELGEPGAGTPPGQQECVVCWDLIHTQPVCPDGRVCGFCSPKESE